jgi:hypothetical protein
MKNVQPLRIIGIGIAAFHDEQSHIPAAISVEIRENSRRATSIRTGAMLAS